MDAQSFKAVIADQCVVVIDVRSAQEYAEGHLASSININVESHHFTEQIAKLDKKEKYALYCRSGIRSTLAADQMAKAGFQVVFNLDQGGFTDLANLGVAISR